jgi:predicted permease
VTGLRVLLNRCLEVLLRRRREERLSEEIQAHLDLLAEEYVERGLPPDEARQAARRAFGAIDRIREDHRSQRGLPLLDTLAQDARFAGRLLGRERGFALAVSGVLALGIGLSNMQFAILNAHTIRGLPIPDADRVLYLSTLDGRGRDRGLSFPEFRDWQDRAGSFASMAAFTAAPVVIDEDGERAPDRFRAIFLSATAFQLVGARPLLGRDFRGDDDRPGAPAVAILDEGAWESRYGRDPAVLGRGIRLDGVPATIVGVMRRESGFPATADVWVPLSQLPGLAAQVREAPHLKAIGRLRDGTAIAAARTEIDGIVSRLVVDHPPADGKLRARVVPVNVQFLGRTGDPSWIAFMAAGLLVVLISSANAANLMLGRSLGRAREIAVRVSLGASRRRIVGQLLMEGAVLAALAASGGLAVAMLGVRLFRSAIPTEALPYWIDYSTDRRVLAALIAVSASTVFIFALLPALHASKTDPNAVLKEGGHPGVERGRRRWTTAFLAAEVGLAVVFLAQFVMNVRTSQPDAPTDAIVSSRDVLTSALALPPRAYDTPERRAAFYSQLVDRISALPAVTSASLASAAPRLGAEERRLEIAGRARRPEAPSSVWTVAVTPHYFDTLGLPLVRGRDFAPADGGPGAPHAIVNERFVELFLAGRESIGQRIGLGSKDASDALAWLTIVGVSPSVRHRNAPRPDPIVYLPFIAQPPPAATLMVRSSVPADMLTPLLRSEVRQLDRNLPLYLTRTMAQLVYETEWVGRLSSNLFLTLTLIAVILSSAGLYAVTSYSVSLRAREIGVRVALGARPREIVRLVARRVALQLALGFAAGLALTRMWDWTFPSDRANITASDPRSLLGVAAILAAVAVIACALPARRAARLDPTDAIRHS